MPISSREGAEGVEGAISWDISLYTVPTERVERVEAWFVLFIR